MRERRPPNRTNPVFLIGLIKSSSIEDRARSRAGESSIIKGQGGWGFQAVLRPGLQHQRSHRVDPVPLLVVVDISSSADRTIVTLSHHQITRRMRDRATTALPMAAFGYWHRRTHGAERERSARHLSLRASFRSLSRRCGDHIISGIQYVAHSVLLLRNDIASFGVLIKYRRRITG